MTGYRFGNSGRQFYTDQEKLAFVEASIGIEAEKFLLTPLGKHLWKFAAKDVNEATHTLINASPVDSKTISEAQVVARSASNFHLWIQQTIDAGVMAEKYLATTDDEQ
jgi:hypothetical protein